MKENGKGSQCSAIVLSGEMNSILLTSEDAVMSEFGISPLSIPSGESQSEREVIKA